MRRRRRAGGADASAAAAAGELRRWPAPPVAGMRRGWALLCASAVFLGVGVRVDRVVELKAQRRSRGERCVGLLWLGHGAVT